MGKHGRSDRNRERFVPTPGEIYENAGGGSYKCESVNFDGSAWMVNVKSGWELLAHGVGRYPDGKIDWNYSTGGHFTEGVKG